MPSRQPQVQVPRAFEREKRRQLAAGKLHALLGSDWLLVWAALFLGLAGYLLGERMPVSGGLGYDGIEYAAVARNPAQHILVEGMTEYRMVRILPSIAVHFALRFLAIPPTDANILRAFELLNVVIIVSVAALWRLLARQWGLSLTGKWFGFLGLFVNYAVAKFASYYPNLTDMSAFGLGAGMLYVYLKRADFVLIFLTFLAAFTFPPAFAVGILLVLFPARCEIVAPCHGLYRYLLIIGCAAFAVLAFALSVVFYVRNGQEALLCLRPPMVGLLWLSVPLACAYLIYGMITILNQEMLWSPRAMLGRVQAWRVMTVAALVVVQMGFAALFARSASGWLLSSVQRIFFASVTAPGISVVAHCAWYGPVFLCTVLLWPRISPIIQAHGVGLTLAAAFAVPMSLLSESRCFVNLVPLIVPFVAKTVDERSWRPGQCWLFVGLCLLGSRFWLPQNLRYPELYFMNVGSFMTDWDYALQIVICLALGYILYRIWSLAPKKGEDQHSLRLQGPIGRPTPSAAGTRRK
jgi:hypothetical protein